MIPKSNAHHSIQVRCSMDEPIQLLIDKLSTKSTDLYVFWQNYNQMYRQYNQKLAQNAKLKEQIQQLRRINLSVVNKPTTPIQIQDPYLKQRLKSSQSTCQSLRQQLQRSKTQNKDLTVQTSRLTEQISQMQILISQLRQENSQQRISIANILQKLKNAQGELANYEQIGAQMQDKQNIISRMLENQRQMQEIIDQRDEEIQQLNKDFKDAKNKYEKIIKQSMQNAKQTVMDSLPANYKHLGDKIRGEF